MLPYKNILKLCGDKMGIMNKWLIAENHEKIEAGDQDNSHYELNWSLRVECRWCTDLCALCSPSAFQSPWKIRSDHLKD